MNNVFKKYPDFIKRDTRTQRSNDSYTVSEDFMIHRFDIFFKDIDLKDKTVLDLGCNVAALGAWVLDAGAKFYHGVEANNETATIAEENLEKNFSKHQWMISAVFVEEFLENCEQFDIIIASGIIYCFFDPIPIIKTISEKAKIVIIESVEPSFGGLPPGILSMLHNINFLRNYPMITFNRQPVIWGVEQSDLIFNGSRVSSGFVVHYMKILNFDVIDINVELENLMPTVYNKSKRFAFVCVKNNNNNTQSEGLQDSLINNRTDLKESLWNRSGNLTNK